MCRVLKLNTSPWLCHRPQSRGADPSIRTEDYDPYLNPGHHLPIDIASEDTTVRAKLLALDEKYAGTKKAQR